MVTKTAVEPDNIKPRSGRRRAAAFQPDQKPKQEKEKRMDEYSRLRSKIKGWRNAVQTCGIARLREILLEETALREELRSKRQHIHLIFTEDFEHIERVAEGRLRSAVQP